MEPALERPQRYAEPSRRGGNIEPLDMAENHRRSVPRRESGDLGVDGLAKLGPFGQPDRGAGRGRASPSSPSSRRARRALRATRMATRYSQPPSDSTLSSRPALRASVRKVAWNASSAACGSLRTRRHAATDHRPVPPDEGRERRLGPGITPALAEPAKQLGVGPLARRAVAEEPDQILADPASCASITVVALPCRRLDLHI